MSGQKGMSRQACLQTQKCKFFFHPTPMTLHAIFLLTNEISFVHDWILHLSELQHLQKCKGQGWPLKKAYTQSSEVNADDSLQE